MSWLFQKSENQAENDVSIILRLVSYCAKPCLAPVTPYY
ncbi:hypothetical protein CPter91_4643 [Collimonas pratensis]|uniref:Uncharacterized protein n=1 Tax=Collimonas pratensis TaxID=279113 RepID=A0A127QAB7_9BURK|nr:hypothetical protein CPter91_4643 [Collimonas pratensis]